MSTTTDAWFGGGDPFEALHIARQKPPPCPKPELMKANIATHPPLGQVTVVTSRAAVHFGAVLEVPLALAAEPWEVLLCQTADGSEWSETQLSLTTKSSLVSPLQEHPLLCRWLFFNGTVSVARKCTFTIKFRSNASEPWRWIREEDGRGDGTVVVRPEGALHVPLPTNLPDLIKELNPVWAVRSPTSQAPGTRLWSLEKAVAAATGEKSHVEEIVVGRPWGSISRSVEQPPRCSRHCFLLLICADGCALVDCGIPGWGLCMERRILT
jgi:hypothetical protein